MVYDCFTFFNELDILDIRLHELNDIVDKFILVEGTVTFTNIKKPLYYDQNKKRFNKFEKKITHIIVKDNPNTYDPWELERFQFNAIKKGLDKSKDDDVILLSCVDEIPKAIKVKEWIKKNPNDIKVFLQQLSYYYLNLYQTKKNSWKGTKMISKAQVKNYKDLYEIREKEANVKILDGGWHFSYIGGIKQIQKKIKAFSHQEYNLKYFINEKHLNLAVKNKKDLFERKLEFKEVTYRYLPLYVQKKLKKFSKFLLPPPKTLIHKFIRI